jgi:two-component system OmpR family sensor kinase
VILSRPLARLRHASAATPLRIKLVGTVLALAAVGLGLAGFATTAALHKYLLDRVDSQLQNFAHEAGGRDFSVHIQGGVPPGYGPGPGPVSVGGSPRPPNLPSQFYVAQYLPSGQRDGLVNLTYPYQQSGPALPVLTTATAMQLSHHAFTVPSRDGRSQWRAVTVVRADGSSVVVASSLTDVIHTTDRVIVLETAIGLVALVIIGLAGSVIINRALRPLVSVETTAAAIADGDLTQRVPQLPERTEVGQLAAALNTMLSQIETAFAHERDAQYEAKASEGRMRQFVADASHELRTPLTSIRGFAELYRLGAAGEEMDLAYLMNRIETEAARMGLMVDDLLLLARLDQQRPLEREPVDVLVVATDVVNDAGVVAADRTITLAVAGTEPPVVLGDESRLRQVLHNLMTNALTHTPADTPIEVTVRTTPDPAPAVVIEVADRGPGMTDEQRTRVFERFYRADPARKRGAGGTGLGLSIVAGLVAAHHGTVTVTPRDGGGTVFAVTLPLAT